MWKASNKSKLIHNSNSVVSAVKTMRFHKILSFTLLIDQSTSKFKVLFIGFQLCKKQLEYYEEREKVWSIRKVAKILSNLSSVL